MDLRSRFLLFLLLLGLAAASEDVADFTFNGFRGSNLSLDGSAVVTSGGLMRLTDATKMQLGYAFFPQPIRFRSSPYGATFSFSSNFVFAIISPVPAVSGHGLAFVISPSAPIARATGAQYLGLFNTTNNGNPNNHIIAVELDLIQNADLNDINDNHVGIDVNSVSSIAASAAGYNTTGAGFTGLSLSSGEPMQIWVEYDGIAKLLNVTLSPMSVAKTSVPLVSAAVDLTNITMETMYVGFSSSTGTFTTSHMILGWSFKMNGTVQPFDLSTLPQLPKRGGSTDNRRTLVISLSVGFPVAVLAIVVAVVLVVARRRKFSELLEDWEQEYGPHRFSYKQLYTATNGFRDTELLGAGGFGKVYRGAMPTSNMEVAIKKISHDSRQGMREFVAEIASIGRLRHRSLAQLLGYCRRKGELLLVYDYMPNGSLDKLLFDRTRPLLGWDLRYRIIKDVAFGILYLHEEWEQVVIHRDIKASNVLLDSEFNGKLGDFGLARLYDHKTGPRTTHVVGTMGYIAPELTRTSKATTETDVFAFGAFLLEVACGRRPVETQLEAEEMMLVDWVLENWRKGDIMSSVDPRLESDAYEAAEVEKVLLLGLYCSHPLPSCRPSIRLVTQILDGDAPVPDLSPGDLIPSFQQWQHVEGFDHFIASCPSPLMTPQHGRFSTDAVEL